MGPDFFFSWLRFETEIICFSARGRYIQEKQGNYSSGSQLSKACSELL